MDIETYYNTPRINNTTSLAELQEQSAFTLNVEVRKGKKITGGFGKTFYKAEWIDREESPVILIEMKENKNEVSNEVYLYITLNHPHIIKTYGIVDPNNYKIDSNSILLLQEYAEDGDLGSMLTNRYFIPEQNVLLEIFIQVADAMIFLSKNGIIHGDLACRNVLVFKSHPHDPKKNLVKLIDFGSTQNNSISSNVKIEIPVRYVAQEILCSKGHSGYSEKSDVYSFAVFMWEACSFGKMPYENINDDEEVSRQKLDGRRLTRPNKCDPNIWKLMELCWNDKPGDRPNFQKIYTQLKNIQNVQSSSFRPNSILFQIEYKTCQKCNLRYTDYDSHLKNCSEEEQTCYICGKQYRRASFDNHKENCHDLSDDYNPAKDQQKSNRNPFSSPSNIRLSSRAVIDRNDSTRLSSASDRSRFDSSTQSDRNNRSFKKKPSVSSRRSTNPEEDEIPRKNVREKQSQLNTIQLPCEICGKLFDVSQLPTHQRQCDRTDRERVEKRRREIEQRETTEKVECSFCRQSCLIEEIDHHQSACSFNPENVLDERSVSSSTRSNTFPIEFTESSPQDNEQEPSCFQKIFLCLLSFKKKG